MDGLADVDGVGAHLDGQRDLADHVAGVGADDAAADDAVGFFIEDQLGEALVAAVGNRPAGGGPGKLADADRPVVDTSSWGVEGDAPARCPAGAVDFTTTDRSELDARAQRMATSAPAPTAPPSAPAPATAPRR